MSSPSRVRKSITVSLGGRNPFSIKASLEFIASFYDWVAKIKSIYPTTNINALLRSAVYLLMTDEDFANKAINHSLEIAQTNKSHSRQPLQAQPIEEAA